MAALSVFPYWKTNPYLNLLLLEPRARGWQIRGGNKAEHFFGGVDLLAHGDVFHLHWTRPLSENVGSAEEFNQRVRAFIHEVARMRNRGIRILWTVHNTIAHDSRYVDLEVALARNLCELADVIVVLNSHTPEATVARYELPRDKVFHLPHPSYLGVYSEDIDPMRARRALRIPDGDDVVGFVGAIRPYKGVGDFLAAAHALAAEGQRFTLVLAGNTHEDAWAEINAHLPLSVPSIRHHEHVPDESIGHWVAACSVMVLPFREMLNSGSLMLAATYGVPVVLPDLPHLVSEFGDQPWITFFRSGGSPEQRAGAIAQAIRISLSGRPGNQRSAAQFARSYTPWDMSVDYANLLEHSTHTQQPAQNGQVAPSV
ncbi:glycosyltransferase [Tessaracoccus sp. Y1736]